MEILLSLQCQTTRNMKSDAFHRLVERNGWTYLRKSGSHVIYKIGSRTYPVPYHGSKNTETHETDFGNY